MDLLSRIADDRRRHVEEMKARVPPHALRKQIAVRPAGRLERALRRPGPGAPLRVLCEIQRASPAKGVLHTAVDPAALARIWEAGGAAAVSLVTEPDHFRGEAAWVDAVRPAVRLPILVKDFVIDSYQVLDAAARGADAVQLLSAMLSEVQVQRLVTEARLVGLDALVEVHDAGELKRALQAGATLVGIDSRDPRSFEVRPATVGELLPLVPPFVTVLIEGGLTTPEDLARLRPTRCDAVLLSEALAAAGDPAAVLASFLAAARG